MVCIVREVMLFYIIDFYIKVCCDRVVRFAVCFVIRLLISGSLFNSLFNSLFDSSIREGMERRIEGI